MKQIRFFVHMTVVSLVFAVSIAGASSTSYRIAPDSALVPIWDTLATVCDLKLSVGNNGNLGQNSAGFANLNFLPITLGGVECDTGLNSRGNAAIYLAEASPLVVRHPGPGVYTASWAIRGALPGSPNGFIPLSDGAQPYHTVGGTGAGSYLKYFSGTFCTADSLVKLERSCFVPIGAFQADSCHLVIVKTRYFPFVDGQSVSNLAIGDFFDFDLPSDSTAPEYNANVAGTDLTRRMVYVRGFNSPDEVADCYDNSLRYAGASLLQWKSRSYWWPDSTLYGAYNAANDSFIDPASTLVPEQLWANMQSTGYSNEVRITDLHSVLTYKNGVGDVGFTLPANDTLTVWTAIAVVRPTGGTTAQGLDSLKREIDKARKWYTRRSCIDEKPDYSCSCCIGNRGNINKGPAESPDLSDLSYLISFLTAVPHNILPCPCEADLNRDLTVDLSDLACLILELTDPLVNCIGTCGPLPVICP